MMHRNRHVIFGSLSMAAGVVNPVAHSDSVWPNKFLRVIEPPHFKLFLAYRANAVGKHRIVGNWYPVYLLNF